MKSLFSSLLPFLSSVFLALRIDSNAIVIKHISECPRSKFQERFACHISIAVRGASQEGATALQGNQVVLKGSLKRSAFEKVPVDAKLLHTLSCTDQSYFLILQPKSL